LQHLKALLPHHLLLFSSNNVLSPPISVAAAMQIVENPMPGCVDFFFVRPRGLAVYRADTNQPILKNLFQKN
jgi:hypothetical protein